MIECVSETIVFLYRKRTALPAPLCREVLVTEVPGGRCTLQAHFQCTPQVPEASSFGRMSRQGLLFRDGCIPAWRNPPLGIIFPRRMHPCSEKSTVRDYFPEADASLLEEFHRLGLFFRAESIPARRNSPSGIIFPRQKHPCLEKSPVRDYFPETKASLLEEIPFQGLFSQGESIPCSRKSPVRDYFPKAEASLLEEIPRQGLFSRG